MMGLAPVREKNDDLFVRIWLWDFGEHYVIDIDNNENQNACSMVCWKSKTIGNQQFLSVYNINHLIPKDGWMRFFDTLEKYQITTLTNGLKFSEHHDYLTHSSNIQFEISKHGKYRFYEYVEPSFYRFVESGAMNIYHFLLYFNKQMNISIYKPAANLYEKSK